MTVEPIELDLVSMEPHFLVMLRSQLLTRLGAAVKPTNASASRR
jgi:aspartyl-tRNA(Asn)/glutamyl-tRNA(Gln) amidotransferase subunit A